MNYLSTLPFSSTHVAGLVFQLKKMGHGRRIEFNLAAAESEAELRDERRVLFSIDAEIETAEDNARIEPCICKGHDHEEKKGEVDLTVVKTKAACSKCECRRIDDQLYVRRNQQRQKIWNEIMVKKVYPAYIRWAVTKIDGFQIDGVDATVDSFLLIAPDELVIEVGTEINRILHLSFEEQLGFGQPTTLNAQVDGQTLNTSA